MAAAHRSRCRAGPGRRRRGGPAEGTRLRRLPRPDGPGGGTGRAASGRPVGAIPRAATARLPQRRAQARGHECDGQAAQRCRYRRPGGLVLLAPGLGSARALMPRRRSASARADALAHDPALARRRGATLQSASRRPGRACRARCCARRPATRLRFAAPRVAPCAPAHVAPPARAGSRCRRQAATPHGGQAAARVLRSCRTGRDRVAAFRLWIHQ